MSEPPPDIRVAEIALEPDETHAATLAHMRTYEAALPVALEGIVSMWTPHGWQGTLDGRPVSGSLDRFNDATEGSVTHSASIERRGSRTLEVIVDYAPQFPEALRVTAQAVTSDHAERIAQAAADAWREPPPLPTSTTRLERAGRRDTRLWAARQWVSRKPASFIGSLVGGAALTVLGVSGRLEDAVRWVLDTVGL